MEMELSVWAYLSLCVCVIMQAQLCAHTLLLTCVIGPYTRSSVSRLRAIWSLVRVYIIIQ